MLANIRGRPSYVLLGESEKIEEHVVGRIPRCEVELGGRSSGGSRIRRHLLSSANWLLLAAACDGPIVCVGAPHIPLAALFPSGRSSTGML